jgi:hypothetical protein
MLVNLRVHLYVRLAQARKFASSAYVSNFVSYCQKLSKNMRFWGKTIFLPEKMFGQTQDDPYHHLIALVQYYLSFNYSKTVTPIVNKLQRFEKAYQ